MDKMELAVTFCTIGISLAILKKNNLWIVELDRENQNYPFKEEILKENHQIDNLRNQIHNLHEKLNILKEHTFSTIYRQKNIPTQEKEEKLNILKNFDTFNTEKFKSLEIEVKAKFIDNFLEKYQNTLEKSKNLVEFNQFLKSKAKNN